MNNTVRTFVPGCGGRQTKTTRSMAMCRTPFHRCTDNSNKSTEIHLSASDISTPAETEPISMHKAIQQGEQLLALYTERERERHYATSRKVAGSRPDEVNELFQCS
jgi:CCR4-NOT transcriptional regulation complex NOT5 subunit